MFCFLLISLLYSVTNSEQQDPIESLQSQTTNNGTETSKNVSVSNDKPASLMLDMQRITQPMEVMDRTSLEQNSSVAENRTDHTNRLGNFKPSPHLGNYYERNTVPVKPAAPEAKTFSSYFPETQNVAWPDRPHEVATWMEKQSQQSPFDYNRWKQQHQGVENSLAPPWTDNTVKFPNHNFPFNKRVPVQTTATPAPSFWDRLMGIKPSSQQKTFQDYNLLEAPPHSGYQDFQGHRGHDFGGLAPHVPYGGYGANPWKKIIQALATIVPIGLFISALTPTVITVSSTNDTSQSRYRLEDSTREDINERLSSSLGRYSTLNEDGCEDKVLCELLVSASYSNNAERHIRNLLDNFVNQKDIQNKKKDLLRIFEAVKDQDCSSILCENMKKPT